MDPGHSRCSGAADFEWTPITHAPPLATIPAGVLMHRGFQRLFLGGVSHAEGAFIADSVGSSSLLPPHQAADEIWGPVHILGEASDP